MTKLSREEVEEIVRTAREKGERPDLRGADLSKVNLIGMDLIGVNLSGANLLEAKLSGANLLEADLLEANLLKANFSGADLLEADLSRVSLLDANLIGVNLRGAVLNGADLSEADLSGADLSRAVLRGANLSGANLRGVNFRWANLSGANLAGANLSRANLSGVNLSGTNLSGVTFGGTIFGDVDLSEVKELETVKHGGPSTIGIDTLFLFKGQIPEVFLRGAGVSEALITYLPSIMAQPIQYYSCFISYASKDTAFAERLHADLQQKGVRCWFAPEDLKIGDKIRPRIDESIRIHDKLLLILSEYSVTSQWVEHEVEHALDLENERQEPVLFPIRLDEAVMESKIGWTGNIRRTRHIGDFSRWKDHDVYRQAFERLLRDLKAEKYTIP